MNEQLQKELAAWFTQLRDAANAGASFALEQAPLIVQEKIAYGRVQHTAMLAIEVLALVGVLFILSRLTRRAINYKPVNHMDDGILPWMLCVPIAIIGIVAVVSFTETFPCFAQVWFAPRIYVIEWLAGLVR